MKYSKKMVLISEDEYSQLMSAKENATESCPTAEKVTKMDTPSEKVTKSETATKQMTGLCTATEKMTQTEPRVTPYPIQSKWGFSNRTKSVPTRKQKTKTDTVRKVMTKSDPTRKLMIMTKNDPGAINHTKSGSGMGKFRPQGPPGTPQLKEKSTKGLPLGWIDF